MSKHISISPAEASDRLAIRELVEAYAHYADRRDAEGQMSLFTADTHFVVYMNAKDPRPSQELHSREALAPIFADLNSTTRRCTSSDRARSFRLPAIKPQERRTLWRITHGRSWKATADDCRLRYSDQFVKVDGEWLFAERLLYVDWIEERVLA